MLPSVSPERDNLLEKNNVKSLHQARVTLRRLRAALSLFRPLFRDETAKRLSVEFRWLAGILGEVRNLDVLLPKTHELREQLTTARSSAYDHVVDALGSYQARALMLDFNEWLRYGEFLDVTEAEDGRRSSTSEFATKALNKLRRKLKKHGRDLAKIDDDQRHEARKDAKKLRYAAEFFGSLFAHKRCARRYKRFF